MTAPRDVLARVPQGRWLNWLAEGDWPGEEATETWAFGAGRRAPELPPGSRCYIAAFGLVRGYAELLPPTAGTAFLRRGGAVAITVPGLELQRGQWSWCYRTWDRAAETTFPDWATAGLPPPVLAATQRLVRLRADPTSRAILRRRALAGLTTARALFAAMPA